MEIGIWGDSITYGESDIDGLGWVGRLRKKMLDTASVFSEYNEIVAIDWVGKEQALIMIIQQGLSIHHHLS
jgi:hypothetical protein